MTTIVIANDSVTATLNGHTFNSLAVGDNIVITPANPFYATSRHRNGDSIQKSAVGDVATITMNIQKYTGDHDELDKWISGASTIITGKINQHYVKDGEEFNATHSVTAGAIITKPTNTFNDTEGNDILSFTIEARVK